MWVWCWGLERRLVVDVLMTGNGRCQPPQNMLGKEADGGGDTEERSDPLSRVPVTGSPTPVPPAPGLLDSGTDFYTQALKALSERSPFDSPEVLATTVPTLPSGLGSGLLARQSDGRKRHKKSHSDPTSSKKGSTERPKRSSIWVQYEEYFRDLVGSDIDLLHKWSTSFDFLVSDTCLSIPVLGNGFRNQLDSESCSNAPFDTVKLETCVNDAPMQKENVNTVEDQPMEVDDIDGNVWLPAAHESSSPQQQLDSLSSLEWVLGSRNKILLREERPTKKRKFSGGDAGLQRLVAAKSCKGKSRLCHYCSVGDTGNEFNQLVVCSSCDVWVHQKCYGIEGSVGESWECSWCKSKNDAEEGDVACEKGPCVLCPNSGGALKPIQGVGTGNGLSMEFAHLFCSLWMPEVYVDDIKKMEPILDVGRIKDTQKMLLCYLCKVRQGICVWCSDGSCGTSFHPSCAREAGHRLEVWGKLGCEDVELRAYCSKHSHDLDEQGQLIAGISSSSHPSELSELPVIDKPPEVDGKKKDQFADCLEGQENPSNNETQEGSMCAVINSPDSVNLPSVIKKLVDGQKDSLKDSGSQIDVQPDSLAVGVPVFSAADADCSDGLNGEPESYIHPFLQKKIAEIQSGFVKKSCSDFDGSMEMNSSIVNQPSVNKTCSKMDYQADVNVIYEDKEVTLDVLINAKKKGILDLCPDDELEGELIHIQNCLFGHVAKRKYLSDSMICGIVKNLPHELQMVRKQRWDSVLVHQYLHELRETRKQGRKERKFKEAQEILAAATAAAAASSRTSLRKDGVDEASHQQDKLNVLTPRGRVGPPSLTNLRVKETTSSLAVSRNMFDKHLDSLQISAPVSKEHPRFCEICGRSETILNPILICTSCKVAVHLLCYRNVKESAGPWYCEHCENTQAKGSIIQGAIASDKPNTITKCSLCGISNGALRKTSGSQWVHAICAEWVFESTYRRGQATPVAETESAVRGKDLCCVCHERFGVCLKCNFGACQSTFHPSCARSAGYYMSVRSAGGKQQQQRRAYCQKHSIEQRAKIEGQKHGVEELKSLKQVRVELEKLRLICERIVKREKLKREFVLVSHDLLASKKDTLAFSPLFQSPLLAREGSSESATTSIRCQTDCSLSCSTMQKSDDVTVDSTVSGGNRRIKLVVSADAADRRTEDSLTSKQRQQQQLLPTPKSTDRTSFAGKHLPLRASFARRNIQETTGGKKLKSLKYTETFEKELVMTSDQANVKNQRLPKGYIYVPIDRLSTEEQTERDPDPAPGD